MWKRIFLWSYIMLCIGAVFLIMGKNCVVAEEADTNVIGNTVSEPEQQTIVVPFWDTKENMHYESVNETLEFMDNPKIYTIQMKKDGLLCLAVLVKKLDVYYPEIELKDVNGKHIQDLNYVQDESKITSESFPPIYLKAGTYNLEVRYYDEDYDEDYDEYYNEDYEGDQSFEQESTDDTSDGNEPISIKHELKYEIRYSAVQEETSSNWNLKKTKFRSTKNKKMYYKKINIKKDGLLKVYAQTIGEEVLWDYMLGKKIDEEDWGISVILCDKNKKEKGGAEFMVIEEPAVFAVKKGTYYIKIEGANQWHRIWSKFTAMGCGAKTKKKAITLTSKYKSYLLPTFVKVSDSEMWFKFSVKKPKKNVLIYRISGRWLYKDN
ncbi:MAG: hypothetical protein K2N51_11935 [Lachnospiraceae bacterium]|nr:hypothetical protein [Lachnospiraceae bacterium]